MKTWSGHSCVRWSQRGFPWFYVSTEATDKKNGVFRWCDRRPALRGHGHIGSLWSTNFRMADAMGQTGHDGCGVVADLGSDECGSDIGFSWIPTGKTNLRWFNQLVEHIYILISSKIRWNLFWSIVLPIATPIWMMLSRPLQICPASMTL